MQPVNVNPSPQPLDYAGVSGALGTYTVPGMQGISLIWNILPQIVCHAQNMSCILKFYSASYS